jgi:DNA polymerase-3 subunit beta
MKFKCFQKKLSEAIAIVQRAVSSRSTLPILQGILIEAKENTVKLTGTDLDITIQTHIEAEIIEKGSVVMPSQIFGDMIRKFPETDITIQLNERFQMDIVCQNNIFTTVQGLEPYEYPEVQLIEDKTQVEVQQNMLKKMIQQTVFAVATDETRPILTGALLEIENGTITMVCLDGYRLALRKELVDENNINTKVIIPGKSFSEISRILKEDDSNLKINIGEKHIVFDLGDTRIISRLLEGEFVNYKQIIPQEYKTRVKIDRLLLFQSIERASLMARELENNLVKLNIRDDKLIITSNSDIGKIYEEIPVILEGKNIEIAFNARYLLEVIRVIKDNEICLDFTTNVSPCIIRPIEGEVFCYLILPVRLHG